jgi:hypothetical protein
MTNKYLTLIKEASAGEVLRGSFSPAWMEHNIAGKHGKQGPKGIANNIVSHVTGTVRSQGRSLAEYVAGGAAGAGVGALTGLALKKKLGPEGAQAAAMVGGGVGALGGSIHGALKSLSNQAKEMHSKYSGQEKKAAFDKLVELGVDFDQAIALVEKEAGVMDVAKRVGSMVGGKAKTFATAVKTDAMKVPDQASNIMRSIKDNKGMMNSGTGSAIKAFGKNRAIQTGVAGAAAVGATAGAAMSRGQEKKACMEKLIASGVDFDTAVELTKQAEQEIYGK